MRQVHRREPFEHVREKHSVSIFFPNNAQNVRRTDIAAALFTDIHTGEKACEITGRERAEQIADQKSSEASKQHRLNDDVLGRARVLLLLEEDA